MRKKILLRPLDKKVDAGCADECIPSDLKLDRDVHMLMSVMASSRYLDISFSAWSCIVFI